MARAVASSGALGAAATARRADPSAGRASSTGGMCVVAPCSAPNRAARRRARPARGAARRGSSCRRATRWSDRCASTPNAAAVSIARVSTLGRGTASTSSTGIGARRGAVSVERAASIVVPSSVTTSAVPMRAADDAGPDARPDGDADDACAGAPRGDRARRHVPSPASSPARRVAGSRHEVTAVRSRHGVLPGATSPRQPVRRRSDAAVVGRAAHRR